LTFNPSTAPEVQCAGQDCPDRKNCQRFRNRRGSAPYASFDLERTRYTGPCLHRIAVFDRSHFRKGAE
jgi:hypothetical protein